MTLTGELGEILREVLEQHMGHQIVVCAYAGQPCIECLNCHTILIDVGTDD